MTSALFFEGSRDLPVGFDIETYSPHGFPHRAEDPIVNFSFAMPLIKNLRKVVFTISFICHPSLEERLLRLLHNLLCMFRGKRLLTYNGSKFDVDYVVNRGRVFGLDFKRLFLEFRNIDLYRIITEMNPTLVSYSQKSIERQLGLRRLVEDVVGSSYNLCFDEFLRATRLKAAFYNIEDSAGCLHILDRLALIKLIC